MSDFSCFQGHRAGEELAAWTWTPVRWGWCTPDTHRAQNAAAWQPLPHRAPTLLGRSSTCSRSIPNPLEVPAALGLASCGLSGRQSSMASPSHSAHSPHATAGASSTTTTLKTNPVLRGVSIPVPDMQQTQDAYEMTADKLHTYKPKA